MTEPHELRLAVAMNGGISLAVWIGGVATELHAFVEGRGEWTGARRQRDITTARIDVLAGTSAGGLNAVFLALAQAYDGADLALLRSMWLDLADFDGQLLRDPSTRDPSSFLDGDYFHDRLLAAIHALVKDKTRSERPVDLFTTATAVHGEIDDVRDDFGDTFPNNRHEVLFHFTGRYGTSGDFVPITTPADHLVRQLALASRATASFPFAFEPWFCDPHDHDVFTDDERRRVDLARARFLMDGGVLNNLPVDRAIDAVFELPAEGKVERVLAAVVPLHMRAGTDDARRRGDTRDKPFRVGPTVAAAALGIPRNENDATALRLVGENNDAFEANRSARHALYRQSFAHVVNASDALWESYRTRAAEQSLRATLKTCTEFLATCECIGEAPRLEGLREAARAARIQPDDFDGWPWIPTELVSQHVWSPPAIRRAAAAVLDLAALARDAGCKHSDLADVKNLAHDAITRATLAYSARPGAMVGILLGDKLSHATSPAPLAHTLRTVFEERECDGETRVSLHAAFDNLGSAVDKLHATWKTTGTDVPTLLDSAMAVDVSDRIGRGRELVARLEVLQTSFAGMAEPSQQKLKLAMISPSLRAPIDPRERVDPKQKLSGDELAHFGAFLNRSWRANDWLWGRLDGATALGAILGLDDDVVKQRQREIVEEEAFYLCDAVVRDSRRGARCHEGKKLFRDKKVPGEQQWRSDQSPLSWDELLPLIGADDPATFVGQCTIGQETARSEFRTRRGRRLLARAGGTSTGVLIHAGFPMQRALNILLRPARAAARLARLIFR
jgi:predicted acylesterase/phospholipase RssA